MKQDIYILFLLFFLVGHSSFSAEADMIRFDKLLTENIAPLSPANPKETIYRRNNILFCSGESYVAIENNNGAGLMQTGNYKDAVVVFEQALKHAPLFYPYLYNLGKSYSHLRDYSRAFLYFRKAQSIVPEYFLTYIEMGKTYETFNHTEEAIEYYRKAAHLNPDYLDSYIFLGNAYLTLNRRTLAKKYYDTVLQKDPYYPNGLLGKARLQFYDNQFYRAYMTLKIIDTEDTNYDKAYHYYYAECAYKLQNYSEAYEQYEKLLEYKNDRFFLTTSIHLIRHKMELSKRFHEQEELQRQLQGND